DPGADSPWAADINWGDGKSHTTFNVTTTGADGLTHQLVSSNPSDLQHTYDDNGTYTITVKVTDKDGAASSKTFQVVVANTAPTATFSLPASKTVDEGTTVTAALTSPGDASSADIKAGLHYAVAVHSLLGGASYAGSGLATTASFFFGQG